MRVRVQTSPLGMCLRIVGLLIVGGLMVVVVQQTDWYKANVTRQQPATTQPAPEAIPSPSPAPSPAPTVVKAVARPPAAATPSGWTNILGILIPPPGCGETNTCQR